MSAIAAETGYAGRSGPAGNCYTGLAVLAKMVEVESALTTALRAGRNRPLALLIDDESGVRALVGRIADEAGFDTIEAESGPEGLRRFYESKPDLVVLDVGLPGMDGWEVLGRIRELASTPILMLTANDSQPDKVRGLRHGADDYVTKPFGNGELAARLEALLRRGGAAARPDDAVYQDELVRLDFAQQRMTISDREVPLTPTEFSLAAALVRHPGQILSHQQLLEMVWNGDGSRPQVKLYVGYLRRKLRDAGAGNPVETVRGFGYRWQPPHQAEAG